MTPLSQRDPRWGQLNLGHGTTKIHDYGCTITALSMLAGIFPDETNERLKKVNGYAGSNKNLIIWSKINEAIPWLQFVERGHSYDNNKVAVNLPCLVEVDGKRIGATRHWVLYIGNGQMNDPWFGNTKSTSFYTPTGYAIIKRVGNPPGGNMSDQSDTIKKLEQRIAQLEAEKELDFERITSCRTDRTNLESENDQLKLQIKTIKENFSAEREALKEEASQQKEIHKDALRWFADNLNTTQDLAAIRAEIVKLIEYEDLADKRAREIMQLNLTLEEAKKDNKDLRDLVEDLKRQAREAKGLGDASTVDLINELIRRIQSIIKR